MSWIISVRVGFEMTLKLRDYQLDSIERLKNSFLSHSSPCLVLPTGAGKTATVLSYLETYERDATVTWLAPRVSLIDQTWRQAKKILTQPERMRVCTVQSLLGENKPLPKTDLCVVDEAHFFYGTREYGLIAHHWARRLAATATPTRADFAPMAELCDDLVVGPQRRALAAAGHLPSMRTCAPPARRERAWKRAVDVYREQCPNERCIVFCETTEAAERVYQEFNAAGISTGIVTVKHGEKDLELHAAGFLCVLVNVYMVSVGYDDPTVTSVILDRKFGNATSYIQACGRARGVGASYVKIFDLYGACHEWGLCDEDKIFSLGDIKPIRVKADQKVSLQECPTCAASYRPSPFSAGKCPNCLATVEEFKTDQQRRREKLIEKNSVDTNETRFRWLQKQVAIMHNSKGKVPHWVPLAAYIKRYGERPPTDWLVAVKLRHPE